AAAGGRFRQSRSHPVHLRHALNGQRPDRARPFARGGYLPSRCRCQGPQSHGPDRLPAGSDVYGKGTGQYPACAGAPLAGGGFGCKCRHRCAQRGR
ncbi:unnamed protein product, partial [Symbiodinium microadriaticum]